MRLAFELPESGRPEVVRRAPDLVSPPRGCLTRADVGDRFGPKDPGPPRPSAHRPPDAPEFDPHPRPWGEIRLGYGPTDGCLKQVVLDATP